MSIQKASPVGFYISPVIKNENYYNLFSNYQPRAGSYEIKKYHHLTDGLQLHSWAIFPANQGVGASVTASDPLSVFNMRAGIQYNQNEKNTFEFVQINYAGLYPVIGIEAATGHRTAYETDSSSFFQWKENNVMVTVDLPLNLTKEAFTQYMKLSASLNHVLVDGLAKSNTDPYVPGNGSYNAFDLQFSYTGFRQMAPRDFYPAPGLVFSSGYSEILKGSDFNGSLFSLSTRLYLGGISRHHSLQLHIAHETQSPSSEPSKAYYFPSSVLFFRGYDVVFHKKFTLFSIDYALPLFYPDISLGPLIYIKRIRTNLFADFGQGKDLADERNYFSYGMDLLFDINLFRLYPEFDMGIRVTLNREQETTAGFILLQRFNY